MLKLRNTERLSGEKYTEARAANKALLEQCESYDEYRLHCTIEGIEPLFTRREFDEMKQPGSFTLDGLAEVSQRYGVKISTMLGLAEEDCDGINL